MPANKENLNIVNCSSFNSRVIKHPFLVLTLDLMSCDGLHELDLIRKHGVKFLLLNRHFIETVLQP